MENIALGFQLCKRFSLYVSVLFLSISNISRKLRFLPDSQNSLTVMSPFIRASYSVSNDSIVRSNSEDIL
jgi:hypothetical protein